MHLHVLPILTILVAAQNAVLTPAQERRAEHLLEARLPCRGCHVVGGRGGRVGPALDGVKERRAFDYVQRMIAEPQAVAPGAPMPKVAMPAAERDLIARYVWTRPAGAAPGAAPARRLQLDSASELYRHYCAACHGAAGRGDGVNARHLPVKPADHGDRAAMSARTDDRLFDGIHGGGVVLGRSPLMPGFGQTLTAPQIRQLVAYIRMLCKCRQPGWANAP